MGSLANVECEGGPVSWMICILNLLTSSFQSRVKMVNKLCRRSQGGFEKQAVTDALDNGELEQLCVEISSQGHRDLSIAFGQRMGCILEEM